MYQTKEEAVSMLDQGEAVEYCDICEAWTIIGVDGYPMCLCV